MSLKIIDSHMHCGIQNCSQPISEIAKHLKNARSDECCLFSPVCDIYDRKDKSFYDTEEWILVRRKANQYLLDCARTSKEKFGITVHPYIFVWNDFDCDWKDGGEDFQGVKWHRHSNEPNYDYKSPKCEEFLQKVYKNKLPIVYEEELHITKEFVNRVNGRTNIIIPHLGMLNGGFRSLKEQKIWDIPWVYADLSISGKSTIKEYVKTYGSERLLFGSDWPFSNPKRTKQKFFGCFLQQEDIHNIMYKNIQKLLSAGEKDKI